MYPVVGTPNLEDWTWAGPRATENEKAVVGYNYDAACWLVSSVGEEIGQGRMTDVLDLLIDGGSPYTAGSIVPPDGPVTWRNWLDAVDEAGMVPAGEGDLDLIQRRLGNLGIATDQAELAARSEARAAYHELIDATGPHRVPEAVRAPLAAWDFVAAFDATRSADSAFRSLQVASRDLPESDALNGPVMALWETAGTPNEIGATELLARNQASAAHDVAAARALAERPRELIEQIGLVGVDTGPMVAEAIRATRNNETVQAISNAADISALVEGASGTGWSRVGFGALGLLVVAAGWLLVVRRRRAASLKAALRDGGVELSTDDAEDVGWQGSSSVNQDSDQQSEGPVRSLV